MKVKKKTYMYKHDDPILSQVQIRLDRMCTNVHSSLESTHGVFGEHGFVSTVRNGLREP